MRRLTLLFLIISTAAMPVRAQDSNAHVRFLIPVSVVQVAGAHGSLWSTELWYRNNSVHPVAVFPLAVSDWVPTIGLTQRLPLFAGPPSAPATFLYATSLGSDEVQFDLRLFNRADVRSSWGVKLPVVRDDAFHAGVVSLIRVPTHRDFRAALRIYGLPENGPAEQTVSVRVFSQSEELLATRILTFHHLGTAPRYAQVLGIAEIIPLQSRGEPVRVEIEGNDPAVRLWAFVSVTANETQHVSIITEE